MIWLFAIPTILAVVFGIAACLALSTCAPSRVPPPLLKRPRGTSGTIGPRLIQIPGTDTWAYGYQPTDAPTEHIPPQGGSVIAPPSWESGAIPETRPTAREAAEALRAAFFAVHEAGFRSGVPDVKQEHEATAGDCEIGYE